MEYSHHSVFLWRLWQLWMARMFAILHSYSQHNTKVRVIYNYQFLIKYICTQGFLTTKTFQIDAIIGWSILWFTLFDQYLVFLCSTYCRQTINNLTHYFWNLRENYRGRCCCQISKQSVKPVISPLVLQLGSQVGCQKKRNSSLNSIF